MIKLNVIYVRYPNGLNGQNVQKRVVEESLREQETSYLVLILHVKIIWKKLNFAILIVVKLTENGLNGVNGLNVPLTHAQQDSVNGQEPVNFLTVVDVNAMASQSKLNLVC